METQLLNIMERPNLKFIGIEEGMETQTKGMYNLFNEIISENFQNLKIDMENQIQETYRTSNYNRCTLRHIKVKIPHI